MYLSPTTIAILVFIAVYFVGDSIRRRGLIESDYAKLETKYYDLCYRHDFLYWNVHRLQVTQEQVDYAGGGGALICNTLPELEKERDRDVRRLLTPPVPRADFDQDQVDGWD